MPVNDEHRRRSVRLKGYDYGGPGWFAVTIRASEHAPRLAVIEDGIHLLTGYGDVVAQEWLRAGELRPYVDVDVFVVMPDHLHGILAIDAGHPERTAPGAMQSPAHTLGAIVRAFKTASTRAVNEWRRTPGVPLWRRSYYDQVIRDHQQLVAIRDYIRRNPERWREPERIGEG